MDIMVEGDPGNTRVSGTIKTVPGGNVQYTSQKNFKKVDASDIVTFMDLDAEKDDSYLYQQSSDFALDLNVGIGIEETRVEILLNEIDQEYIEILGSGNLSLRTGLDDQPLIYGEITSGSGRAFIKPSPLPDMDLVIEDATVRWSGRIDEPVVSFRGYKTVRGPARGFSSEFSERNDLVDYRIIVVLDQATLSEFDLEFDLSAEDSQIQTYLASQPSETREFYAINLLVFGRVGAEKLQGNSMLANQVTRKLNELARRNLKNTGIQFSSETYKIGSDGLTDRSRTDLNYAISRGFLNNRLNIKVGGSVGINSDDMTEVPPSDLIGNLEIDYIISRDPSIILKGTRKDVYEGIIDGIVTEESIGISFQKSYPTIKEMFRKEQEEAE
jgi:hypothetical protein